VIRFAVFVLGWWLVKTRLPGAVADPAAAMREEREVLVSEAR